MVELLHMRKAMKGVLIGLVVTVLAVLIALPVAVPPIAETIVRDKLREFGLVNPYVRMKLGYGFNQIAKDSGVSLEAVQKRSAKKLAEKIPSGSGVWLQSEDGTWSQK